MTQATQILLSGALTFGVPLALAIRDLIGVRRSQDGGHWPPPAPEPPPPLPVGGGTPARRELPACLIPVRMSQDAARERLREFT